MALCRDLALANRILYAQGIVDGLGHVSVRHPVHPDLFLLSVNRAPALVKVADIRAYRLDGNCTDPHAPKPYLERFIHSEIYRARPEVQSVVHSHSVHMLPFACTRAELKPIFHMAGFLGQGAARFDIRAAAGDTDMLIRDAYLGQALARALGQHSCVLMRGHGSTVVGDSLAQAVYRAIYAETNAKVQLAAQTLSEPVFLSGREAELAAAVNDSQIPRSWALWVERLGHNPLD